MALLSDIIICSVNLVMNFVMQAKETMDFHSKSNSIGVTIVSKSYYYY